MEPTTGAGAGLFPPTAGGPNPFHTRREPDRLEDSGVGPAPSDEAQAMVVTTGPNQITTPIRS